MSHLNEQVTKQNILLKSRFCISFMCLNGQLKTEMNMYFNVCFLVLFLGQFSYSCVFSFMCFFPLLFKNHYFPYVWFPHQVVCKILQRRKYTSLSSSSQLFSVILCELSKSGSVFSNSGKRVGLHTVDFHLKHISLVKVTKIQYLI